MKKASVTLLLGIGGLLIFGYAVSWVRVAALDASSTNFFVRQGIVTTNGSPTSSSFGLLNGLGQAGFGFSSSTSFLLGSGSLYAILQSVKPIYTQIHYHWRNDDGTEAAATSATGGTQDAGLANMVKSTVKRLRVEISNEGGTARGYSAQQFRIEYALISGTCASSTYTDVGAVAGDWDMAPSQMTEAGDTTNIATATGGLTNENALFLVSNGGQRETTSQTGNLSVPSDTYVEIEYAIQPLAAATDAGTYCFRLTNAGAATDFVYSKYPTSTIAVGGNATPTVSAVSLNHGNPIILIPNATTSVDINFTVTDTDGCTDVFASGNVTSTAFRSGVTASCAASNLNCYGSATSTHSCVSGNSANATTTVALYYFAQATDSSSTYPAENWQVKVNARDSAGNVGSSTSSGVELNTLLAIDVATSSIPYGMINAGNNSGSSNATSTIRNVGNASTTLKVSGVALRAGSLSIATSSQHYATSTFTFGGLEQVITDVLSSVAGFLLTTPTSTSLVQSSLFWGLTIPAGSATGTYTGTNTFSATFAP